MLSAQNYFAFYVLLFAFKSKETATVDMTSQSSQTEQHGGMESGCSTNMSGSISCNEQDQIENHYKLFRWDPVRVGYKREIELEAGKKHVLVTKAVKPPVFVLDDYMEDYECDHVIGLAKKAGLFSSQLHLDPNTIKSRDYAKYELKGYTANFDLVDANKDEKINIPEEIKILAYNINYLYLTDEEVEEILTKFEVDMTVEDGEKYITRESFNKVNLGGLHQYFMDVKENHPRHRDRFSEQVWLNVHGEDKILGNLMERLRKLTNLHSEILYGTEPIQVVHYMPHGHYHAHFDSQDKSSFPDFPCCHTTLAASPQSCRICRFLTALVFLNDVPKGGETAFPVADDPTYSHEEFIKRKKGDMYNLSQYCHIGELVVKPKKGRMVLWYNHLINEEGFLGPLDPYSLHGGCDVIEGEKWIANNWIPAPDTPGALKENVYKPGTIKDAHIDLTGEITKSSLLSETEKISKGDL